MGVLACSRRDCDNIMCDFYSNKYGYLCSSCKIELKGKPDTRIMDFMRSPPTGGGKDEEWDYYVDQLFEARG